MSELKGPFKDTFLQPDMMSQSMRQAAMQDQMIQQHKAHVMQMHINLAQTIYAMDVTKQGLKDALDMDEGALELRAKQALKLAIRFMKGIDGEKLP